MSGASKISQKSSRYLALCLEGSSPADGDDMTVCFELENYD